MATEKEYESAFKEKGLTKYFEALKPFARVGAEVTAIDFEEEHDYLGKSRFGGEPDLPKDVEWPVSGEGELEHPMSFVAQINLEELRDAVPQLTDLPEKGIYYFFRQESEEIGAYGLEAEDFVHCKVIYYDGSLDALERREFPDTLDDYERFSPAHLIFEYDFSLPKIESPWGDALDTLGDEVNEDWDNYYELYDEADGQLLGHPTYVQGSVEEEAAYALTKLTEGTPIPAKLKEDLAAPFGRDEKEWRCLLRVDSVDICNMMWGDLGAIYFMITEDDLAQRRYDRMICCFQCG